MTVKRWVFIIILITGLVACAPSPEGGDTPLDQQSQTWIDAPLPNSVIPMLPYKLIFHGASNGGINEFELQVNGVFTAKVPPSSTNMNGTLFFGEYLWTPPVPGTYLIEVKAIGIGQGSSSDQVYVTVIDEEDIPEAIATPTPTPIPDQPVVNFWAEPQSIPAGGCSMIHWHVENVESVIFGGSPQAFDGFYEDCFCSTQIFPLTVNHLDGSQEVVYMTIEVSGECVTPTPPISSNGQIRVHLFIDANSSGSQERGEGNYREVRVSLRDCSCSARCSESNYAFTNTDGNVLFSNLTYGAYCVSTNSGYTPTTVYPVNVNVNSSTLVTVNIGYIVD